MIYQIHGICEYTNAFNDIVIRDLDNPTIFIARIVDKFLEVPRVGQEGYFVLDSVKRGDTYIDKNNQVQYYKYDLIYLRQFIPKVDNRDINVKIIL